MINFIRLKISKLDEHTKEVALKSSSSLAVKLFGMVATFSTSIILGRAIGPEGLGVVSLANQLVGFVLIFSMFGTYNVILKQTAIGHENNEKSLVANTINTALVINLSLAILFTISMALFTPWLALNIFNNELLIVPFYIAVTFLIPMTLIQVYSAGINGLRKVWQSNLANHTLSAILIIIGLIFLTLLGVSFSVENVLIIYGFSQLLAFVAVKIYWDKLFSFNNKTKLHIKKMLTSAFPLLIVSSSTMIASNADTMMLGWLSNTREVGIYSVAVKLGFLTSFIHVLSASVIGPKIASLFNLNKIDELQQMIYQVNKILMFIGISSCLFFVLLGKSILLMWGNEFLFAYLPLIIISIAQLVNISTGSTGVMLIMTNNEKVVGWITFLSAVLNVTLNFLFIPSYGAIGAAFASGLTIIIENIVKVLIVRRLIGVSVVSLRFKK